MDAATAVLHLAADVSQQSCESPAVAAEKKKRKPTQASLQNLKHDKRCPECQKVHGNAKRGRCNGNDGACAYEFIVNSKRAKSALKNLPQLESLPSDRTLKLCRMAHKFKDLRNKANKIALETGWSFFIMGAGALQEPVKDSRDATSDPFIQSFVLSDEQLLPMSMQVGVLRHGVGAAAQEMAGHRELAQMHARLTFGNLKQQLDNQMPHLQAAKPAEAASPLQQPGVPVNGVASPVSVSLVDTLAVGTPQPYGSTETLEGFMARLEASNYTPVLQKEDIRMRDLLTFIGEEDLSQLGLPLGPRRRILNEVQRLRALGAGQ